MARSQKVETTVCIDDVEFEVSGVVYPGTPARPWAYGGEGDPGDPGEVTDITIRNPETGVEVDYDALCKSDREFIDEALVLAVDDGDDDDRAYDEYRDRRAGL